MAKIESRFLGQLARSRCLRYPVCRLVWACGCEIRGSPSDADKDSSLLGYYTVLIGKCFQTFQERLAFVFMVRHSNRLLVLSHPEDEALRFSETSVTLYHSTCCTISEDLGVNTVRLMCLNPLNPELNPICYLLPLLAHHFLHVSRIRVKSLTLRLVMSYIYGAPILDVSKSHTTTHHSR